MSDPKNMTRRSFFGITAGTVGAAASVSLMGCNERMPRYLVPEVSPSDDTVPGIASYFRTVCRGCSAGCGMTARVREGRAVKVEGNTQHPVSRGALCLRGQAAIEELYSPDRLAKAAMAGKDVDWPAAQKALADGLGKALAAGKQIVLESGGDCVGLGAADRAKRGEQHGLRLAVDRAALDQARRFKPGEQWHHVGALDVERPADLACGCVGALVQQQQD